MPLLDVSDVLSDPMFADVLTLYRSTETVSGHGRGVLSTVTSTISGVVTSADGDVLARLPEGDRTEGSITVHTVTVLTSGQGSIGPDELDWAGQRYIVRIVNDYSRYGAGFVCATCVLKQINP